MSSSATGVGMTICFLGAILLILTQKSSQKFGDVLGIGIGVSISPLIGYLLERQATTLQEGDEPTIEFHSIVHFLLFYDH